MPEPQTLRDWLIGEQDRLREEGDRYHEGSAGRYILVACLSNVRAILRTLEAKHAPALDAPVERRPQ